jgi:hypothetical protein
MNVSRYQVWLSHNHTEYPVVKPWSYHATITEAKTRAHELIKATNVSTDLPAFALVYDTQTGAVKAFGADDANGAWVKNV